MGWNVDRSSGRPLVGVVGGGQLGQMMVESAGPLGIDLSILAKDAGEGAGLVARHTVEGDWTDPDTLHRFADEVDVLTFEHELVPTEIVTDLEQRGVVVRPGAAALRAASDKAHQRRALAELGVPLPLHRLVSSAEEIAELAAEVGWPVVAKAPRGGYDGRGVWWLDSARAADDLVASLPAGAELLVEPSLDLERELATIVVRSPGGDLATYPVVETVQVDGICHTVVAPAPVSDDTAARVRGLATTIAEAIGIVGVLAVELFVVDGEVVVNELAPRPHNSGHLTIEACATSQFENHLRAVLDLPLGSGEMVVPAAVMENVIGRSGPLAPLAACLGDPRANLHLYGKQARPGRKVGHVTMCGDDVAEMRARTTALVDAIVGS